MMGCIAAPFQLLGQIFSGLNRWAEKENSKRAAEQQRRKDRLAEIEAEYGDSSTRGGDSESKRSERRRALREASQIRRRLRQEKTTRNIAAAVIGILLLVGIIAVLTRTNKPRKTTPNRNKTKSLVEKTQREAVRPTLKTQGARSRKPPRLKSSGESRTGQIAAINRTYQQQVATLLGSHAPDVSSSGALDLHNVRRLMSKWRHAKEQEGRRFAEQKRASIKKQRSLIWRQYGKKHGEARNLLYDAKYKRDLAPDVKRIKRERGERLMAEAKRLYARYKDLAKQIVWGVPKKTRDEIMRMEKSLRALLKERKKKIEALK